VLIDELGSGTDPAAGGAIGQAILEKLLENESCRIVSSTHSPRLKALSFNDVRFSCATVLLARGDGDYKLPSYQLQYGLIGDSYALGAASWADPPLPDDVIARAASLLATSSGDGDNMTGAILLALTNSLERQVDEAIQDGRQAEDAKYDSTACSDAMLTMARAYDNRYTDMEKRLEQSIVRRLKDDDDDSVEAIGDTLATLRVAISVPTELMIAPLAQARVRTIVAGKTCPMPYKKLSTVSYTFIIGFTLGTSSSSFLNHPVTYAFSTFGVGQSKSSPSVLNCRWYMIMVSKTAAIVPLRRAMYESAFENL
jgi:hypothetical protein